MAHAKLPENSAALTLNEVIRSVALSSAQLAPAPQASAAATLTARRAAATPAERRLEIDVILCLRWWCCGYDFCSSITQNVVAKY